MHVEVKKTNRNVGCKKLRRFSELYIGSRYRKNCIILIRNIQRNAVPIDKEFLL